MLGFYLLGNLKDLARWELRVLSERRGERFRTASNKFVLVDSDDPLFYRRVAYSRFFGPVRFSFRKLSEFPRLARSSGLQEFLLRNQPFAVRTVPSGMEARFGWHLDGLVNLRAPKTVVTVLRAGKRYYVIAPTYYITNKEFSPRDTKNRAFFHPTSMNAREARLVVNLSGVLSGETFLDPFCGAGGLLIEAASVGARVYGIDIVEDMMLGASMNLSHFGYSGTVVRGDAREIPFRDVDAIATDLPYGRSSKVPTRDLYGLYSDAFDSMYSALKRGRRCVVVADRVVDALLERAGFYVDHVGNWYVHSGLTRRVHICHK